MLAETGPYIIRYPRGYGEGAHWQEHSFTEVPFGKGVALLEGSNVAVICAGPVSYRALEASDLLKASGTDWNPSVYNIRDIKPLDTELIDEICNRHSVVITAEDGTILGGLHGAVSEYIAEHHPSVRVVPIGIPDRYISQGTQQELREECGLTSQAICRRLQEASDFLSKNTQKVLEK